MNFPLQAIGILRTCFGERFGVPRQPGLAPSARGLLKLPDEARWRLAVRGLEQFSHLWLIYVFHETLYAGAADSADSWKPLVRPPRLGGEKKTGVFASRSPHRPNSLGLSAVALLEVRPEAKGGPELLLGGVDLLDGTPVLDMKPYIAYSDAIAQARSAWAQHRPARIPVRFNAELESTLSRKPGLRVLIEEVLSLDPRPAFQARKASITSEHYAFKLAGFDVHWRTQADGSFEVTGLRELSASRESGVENHDGVWLEPPRTKRPDQRREGSSKRSRSDRSGPTNRPAPHRSE